MNRIGSHPERLQNVYFAYALLLRAVNKVGPYLEHYQFRTGDVQEDKETSRWVQDLIKSTSSCPPTFDEKSMFRGHEAQVRRPSKTLIAYSYIDFKTRIQRTFQKCI